MRGVDREALQEQRQGRAEHHGGEGDDEEGRGDGERVQRGSSEGGHPHEAHAGNDGPDGQGHLQLSAQELPLRARGDGAHREAPDDAHGRLVTRVAARPDEHGQEEHDGGVRLDQALVV